MSFILLRRGLSKLGASRLPGLHALRGIAATTVVIFHLQAIPKLAIPPELTFIKLYFGMGVPLFFVISAFSLYLSTFSKVGERYWLRTYFIRRLFRIAPLFYLMIAVYLVFLYVKFGKTFSFSEIFFNLTALYNFFPGKHESIVWAGWTIGVEAIIYLLLPFCFVYVRTFRTSLLLIMLAMLVSAQARTMYAAMDLPKSYSYMSLLSQISVFSVGIPAYFIYRHYRGNEKAKNTGRLLLLATIALLAPMFVLHFPILFGPAKLYLQVWALAFGSLLISQLLCPIRLLTNRVTVVLGELSFSLYLWHPLVITLLKPLYRECYVLGLPDSLTFGLCFISTFALLLPVAYLSYLYVEVPGISYGSTLIRKYSKTETAVIEPASRGQPLIKL